jgi:hypothetical protein
MTPGAPIQISETIKMVLRGILNEGPPLRSAHRKRYHAARYEYLSEVQDAVNKLL